MADAQPAVNGAPPSVEGFVRLDFDGSAYSNYIHATSGIEYAKASYRIGFNGEYFDDCLPYDASADGIRKALFGQTSGVQRTRYALRNVSVTRHLSVTMATDASRALYDIIWSAPRRSQNRRITLVRSERGRF